MVVVVVVVVVLVVVVVVVTRSKHVAVLVTNCYLNIVVI